MRSANKIEDPREIGAIADWIVGQGLTGDDLPGLLRVFCERIVALGVPLWRHEQETASYVGCSVAIAVCPRIESLCEPLGCHLLMSATFAGACSRPLRPLGDHTLRGLEKPQELFTLP